MIDPYLKTVEELATSSGITKETADKLLSTLMKDYGEDHVCDEYCHMCDTGRVNYEG